MRPGSHVALLALVALLACKSPTVPAPQELTPASKDEAEALAQPLAKALMSCDAGALAALFDTEWLFRTVARDAELGAKESRTLYEALKSRKRFANEFLCRPGATLAYAGLRTRSELGRLIFHVVDPERPGVLEIPIGKSGNKKVRAVGYFDYRDGWPLRRKLAPAQALENEVSAIEQATIALSRAPGDIRALAAKHLESTRVQTLAVRAAARLGEQAYRSALATYLSAFPDDLSIYLNVIDELSGQEAYGLVDEAIVALGDGLGDGEGLLSFRVARLLDGEDFALATRLGEEALLAHPEQEEAHYRLLEVHVLARNFAGAVAVMRLMGERFNMRFNEGSMDKSHPAYVELLASDEWSSY